MQLNKFKQEPNRQIDLSRKYKQQAKRFKILAQNKHKNSSTNPDLLQSATNFSAGHGANDRRWGWLSIDVEGESPQLVWCEY
jgi:hypothetical protein